MFGDFKYKVKQTKEKATPLQRWKQIQFRFPAWQIIHWDVTFYEPPAATKRKRGSWWKGRRWVRRTYGADARARTPESGGNISRSSPQQRRAAPSISGEVSRKINGLNKAGEAESSIWGRGGAAAGGNVSDGEVVILWKGQEEERLLEKLRRTFYFGKVELTCRGCSLDRVVVGKRGNPCCVQRGGDWMWCDKWQLSRLGNQSIWGKPVFPLSLCAKHSLKR